MAITVQSNNDLVNTFFNFPKGKDVVRVQIMAQQWLWKFRYPGADNVFNTDDDIVTINDLRLPIDKKVVVQMTSKDVIHSFIFQMFIKKETRCQVGFQECGLSLKRLESMTSRVQRCVELTTI